MYFKPLRNIFFMFVLAICQISHAQPAESDLFRILTQQDSLLFNVGFNTCEVSVFDSLVSNDFEFYHDQSGITPSKDVFMEITKNGLCNLDYQPIRKLDEGSLEVFPLKDNGKLYGAIQRGTHRFYAKYPNQEESELTSVARFTHVWLLDDSNRFRLSRVLSYDHAPMTGE